MVKEKARGFDCEENRNLFVAVCHELFNGILQDKKISNTEKPLALFAALRRCYEREQQPKCKTLEELTVWISSFFPAGQESDAWQAVTGEKFTTLGLGGVVQEGESVGIVAVDELTAINYFAKGFCEYAVSVTGGNLAAYKLYWREKPIL
ncbi:MAG: hypothetical protein ACRERV_14585, partial [Methylococcales bacterium]